MSLPEWECHRCGSPATSGSGNETVTRYRCDCGAAWAVPVKRVKDGQPRQRKEWQLPFEILGRVAGNRRIAKPSVRR
jgi:hypothetical protein